MGIKFNSMDKSKANNRRKAAAAGGHTPEATPAPPTNFSNPTKYANSLTVSMPITKNAQYAGSGASVLWTQPMFFSPLHTPQNWQTPSRRRETMQWARFYYMNEPKVAAGVDFYAQFSMNGFKLECKSKKILKYYEKLCEQLDLAEKLNSISHEYFLLGDVFPFLEINCPVCHGRGSVNGRLCVHEDGTFKAMKLMNPDYIEVRDNPIASKPEFYLVPDEELKRIVQRREPKSVFDRLPRVFVDLVSSGQPIPLSDRCQSHIKHNASDYATYGTSMLQRLFTVLAYKTKLMTANWIIAERLILPIRVVKVGDNDRPATDADLSDVQAQLGAVANDPNMTIVTHHAFEYEWYGATGKIHNITQELELIGKEILDGLMLNQAILNGEMSGYCFDEKTLTLTNSGFKHYWEIDPDRDEIACYNPDTQKIEYHLPYEKVVYDYDGEMIHFNTDKIDILVTPNHRMWSAKRDSSKYEFVRAEDIKPRAKFIGAVDGYDGEYQTSIKIGEEEYSIYDYCKLIGYYVSEGWVSEEKRKNRNRKFTTVSIGQKIESKHREDIDSLFNNMFRTHYDNDEQISVYNPSLSEHLKDNFGKGFLNKHLSSFSKNLSTECLEIIIEAMLNGDGSVSLQRGREDYKKSYFTSSEQLANDFAEISFKCGYVTKIRKVNKVHKNKKYFNKTGHEYKTKHQQYVVYISKGFKGRSPTLCSKSKKAIGREITRVPYKGKIYCFSVPYELFVTMRNGVPSIQGNTSAQVGVEVLIRRLENWRNKLKSWVEKHIFLPVAMMQGFIDEKESKESDEPVYLYPTLIWNDLQLRDKTSRIQTLLQCFDKGLVSAQTILDELNLDYDSEVEKLRNEQLMASAAGQVGAGGQGGNLGTMGMGAAVGGAGGAGVPPDMGGEGMAPGGAGGMPGGAPGGAGGAGGAPGGAGGMGGAMSPGGGAMASNQLPTIGKRGSKKQKEEEALAPPPRPIKLTKLEQKVFKMLTSMQVPQDLFAQYMVKVPGEQRPYAIDFAFPKIGIGVEADGAVWHDRPDFQQRDLQRDQKLANTGWRILRFKEEAIDEHPDDVQKIISQHIEEAMKQKKKADENESMIKLASDLDDDSLNLSYEMLLIEGKKIGCSRHSIPYGEILYIGGVDG
jgi:very-short-patch-repair endonuclease